MPRKKRKYTKREGVQYGRPKGWKPKGPAVKGESVPALDFACLPPSRGRGFVRRTGGMTTLFKILRKYCGSKMSTRNRPMCYQRILKNRIRPCLEKTCPAYREFIMGRAGA